MSTPKTFPRSRIVLGQGQQPRQSAKTFYLRRYIRDERRNPIGVMVATPEGVGWSIKAPRDQFNRRLGIVIAEQRVQTGTNARVPDFARPQLDTFIEQSERYFFEP